MATPRNAVGQKRETKTARCSQPPMSRQSPEGVRPLIPMYTCHIEVTHRATSYPGPSPRCFVVASPVLLDAQWSTAYPNQWGINKLREANSKLTTHDGILIFDASGSGSFCLHDECMQCANLPHKLDTHPSNYIWTLSRCRTTRQGP